MENKKQAYLIMAHNNIELLKKLLSEVDDERFDLYIHIDKKAKNFDENELKKYISKSNIYFLQRRSIGWGGYSQIKTTIELLKQASNEYNYKYYHFISGVDFPLKSSNYIYNYFNNTDKEFIGIDSPKYDIKNNERIKYYYFFQEQSKRNFICKFINKFLIYVQKCLNVDRLKKNKIKFQKGANWFSITHDLVKYILSKEKFIYKIFKYSLCGDELFIQTIIINSPFKRKIYKNGINDGHLRYIDWNRGKPYVWKYENRDELLNSPYLWARKFDDINLIDYISNNIK